MKKKITVQLNTDDIKNGKRGSSCGCPVALAVNRAIKDVCSAQVSIGQRFAFIDGSGSYLMHSVDLPEIATQFIRDFDREEEVKPIIFELHLVGLKIKPTK